MYSTWEVQVLYRWLLAKRRIDAKPLSLLAKVLLSDMITFAKQTHGEQLHYERGLHNSVNN